MHKTITKKSQSQKVEIGAQRMKILINRVLINRLVKKSHDFRVKSFNA